MWNLFFDTDNNPTVDNMLIRKIDPAAFPGASHITGVKKSKVGEDIHMIYYQARYTSLYYMTVNLETGAVISTLLYINVKDMRETAFIGSKVMEIGGVLTHQSYSVGYANAFETYQTSRSYREEIGVVMATVRNQESCLKILTYTF